MPRVNNSLPALCFGAELERTEGNDFTRHNGYRPVIASENRMLLMEISNLKDYRVATRLRNMATQLPQTLRSELSPQQQEILRNMQERLTTSLPLQPQPSDVS